MAQLFPKSYNAIGRAVVLSLPLTAVGVGVVGSLFARSDYATGANNAAAQPVPFSHLHHAGQLGIDCRYCHTTVEEAAFAGVPPTKTCMNCHQQMWTSADLLAPVRDSWKSGENGDSLPWERLHNLPDYVYFNHSIHLAKGVGCVSCHGQVDQMHLMYQVNSLLMEWCLDCHRAPEKHLRPRDEVTSMTWKVADAKPDPVKGGNYPQTQAELGKLLKERYQVRDKAVITSCSMCHR